MADKQLETVQWLIEAGADVMTKDKVVQLLSVHYTYYFPLLNIHCRYYYLLLMACWSPIELLSFKAFYELVFCVVVSVYSSARTNRQHCVHHHSVCYIVLYITTATTV
jgi:hypothetical protein